MGVHLFSIPAGGPLQGFSVGSTLDIPAWSASPPGAETSQVAERGKLLSALLEIHKGAMGGSALDVGWSSPFSLRRVDQLLFKVDTPPYLGISGREIPHRLGQLALPLNFACFHWIYLCICITD